MPRRNLEGRDQRQLRALLGALPERHLQAPDPLASRSLHNPVVVEHDLGGGLAEAELVQPGVVTRRPGPDAGRRADALPEQELGQRVAGTA